MKELDDYAPQFVPVTEFLGDRFDFTPLEWTTSSRLQAGTVLRLQHMAGGRKTIFECIGLKPGNTSEGFLSTFVDDEPGLRRLPAVINTVNPASALAHMPYVNFDYEEGVKHTRLHPVFDIVETTHVEELASHARYLEYKGKFFHPFEDSAALETIDKVIKFFEALKYAAGNPEEAQLYERTAETIRAELKDHLKPKE